FGGRRRVIVGTQRPGLRVRGATSHEALDADDGPFRLPLLKGLGHTPDHDAAASPVVDHARQQPRTIAGDESVRLTIPQTRHDRVGRTQVDADGLRRSFGVENVEEGHRMMRLGTPRLESVPVYLRRGAASKGTPVRVRSGAVTAGVFVPL